jgi:uncharacterized protein
LLHLYTLNGDYLAFDSESGALHELDEPAFRMLQAFEASAGQKPPQSVLLELTERFGPAAGECIAEIEELIAAGELFAAQDQIRAADLYPDEPRIKAMCLHLSHDCNLRCRYCFAGTGDFGTGERTMMDLATGQKAVEFLIEASGSRRHLDIDFFGGEPLLNWPVVVQLTEYCEKRAEETGKDIRLTITTNAVLLDDEKIRFINDHFRNCVLSIDGRPEIHDRMRPDAGAKGSHSRVASRISRFVAARGNREYYLRGTYTRHNLDFANDVLYLARLASQISVEPVVARDGCGYEIRPEDVPAIEREYERLASLMAGSENAGRFNFFHFNIDLDEGPCAYKRLKGCGAGIEYCAVTPGGDIYPCHQFVGLGQFRMGHVNDSPVRLDHKIQESFRHGLFQEKPVCRSCWALYFCGGGCAANAWHASGKVDGLYETGCRLEKKRLECALWLKVKKPAD